MAKAGKNASRRESIAAAKSGAVEAPDDDDDVEEESWTFVGGGDTDVGSDLDPEIAAGQILTDLKHTPGHRSPRAGRDRRLPQSVGSRVSGLGSGAVGAVGAVGAKGVGVS